MGDRRGIRARPGFRSYSAHELPILGSPFPLPLETTTRNPSGEVLGGNYKFSRYSCQQVPSGSGGLLPFPCCPSIMPEEGVWSFDIDKYKGVLVLQEGTWKQRLFSSRKIDRVVYNLFEADEVQGLPGAITLAFQGGKRLEIADGKDAGELLNALRDIKKRQRREREAAAALAGEEADDDDLSTDRSHVSQATASKLGAEKRGAADRSARHIETTAPSKEGPGRASRLSTQRGSKEEASTVGPLPGSSGSVIVRGGLRRGLRSMKNAFKSIGDKLSA